MIRAMVIMILAGLTFLRGYLPDGMAPRQSFLPPYPSEATGNYGEPDGKALNPFAYEFCPERYRPKLIPNPSVSPTPTETPKGE